MKKRFSNFELLRIIAMVMIVGSHCLTSTDAVNMVPGGMFSSVLLASMQTVVTYGVNLFALITGYFMVSRTSVSVQKIVKLLLDVALYGVIMYGSSILVGINEFSIGGLIKAALPLLAGYRWFVLAYCVLYLISPLINAALRHISKKQYLVFLGLYAFFFSIWPTFLPYPPLDDYGYSFHHLIFIYLIGGYIRLHVTDVKLSWCAGALAAAFAITTSLFFLDGISIPLLNSAVGYRTANNSVFVVIASVSLFLMFTKVKLQSNAINTLASSAFAVYLLHGDYNMMDYLFNEVFHVGALYSWPIWFLAYPLYMAAIYIFFALVDLAKQKLLDKPLNLILSKIKFLNFKITAMEE